MAASSSPSSDRAIKIALIATVAAVAAYVGYRAYKKQYPFEELMSKNKSKDKKEASNDEEPISDKADEVPIGKGKLSWLNTKTSIYFLVAESDSAKQSSDQVSAVNFRRKYNRRQLLILSLDPIGVGCFSS